MVSRGLKMYPKRSVISPGVLLVTKPLGATSKNPMLLPCLNHILLPYFGSICEAGRHGGILWVPKCQSGLTWALNFSETNCHFPRRFASRDTSGRDYQKPNAFTPLNHKFLTYFGTYFDIRALRTHVYLSSLTFHTPYSLQRDAG